MERLSDYEKQIAKAVSLRLGILPETVMGCMQCLWYRTRRECGSCTAYRKPRGVIEITTYRSIDGADYEVKDRFRVRNTLADLRERWITCEHPHPRMFDDGEMLVEDLGVEAGIHEYRTIEECPM